MAGNHDRPSKPERFHSQLNPDVWIKLRKPLTVRVICGELIVTVE